MKRLIKISIVILFIFSILIYAVSCGESDENAQNINGNAGENASEITDSDTEDSADSVIARIYPDLPEDMDFDGYNFRILVRYFASENHTAYVARDIFAETATGEPINDAVYARNRYVEEKYNCNITQVLAEDHQSRLTRSVRAGTDDYDLYYTTLNEFSGSITRGEFINLNEMPYIDLEKPWWDQNAKNSLSISGKLYFTTCDLILLHNDSSSALLFNKALITSYGLEDPYELVASGNWTVDQLINMSKDISHDVNGDGIMDENDMYGFVCYRDASVSIMHSAGGRIAEKDADDLPFLTLNTENAINALEKAFDLMYAPSSFNLHKELESRDPLYYATAERMFMENRALFYWILLHDVEKFRNMDADFGILPVPKLNASQASYGSTVNQYHGQAIAIPVTIENKERNGIILEALTAASKYTLIPEYYERTLQRKISRDNESEGMLDIIFSSHVYDPGYVYNFGNFSWDIIFMTMSHNRNIISLYERGEPRAARDIERLVSSIQNLE